MFGLNISPNFFAKFNNLKYIFTLIFIKEEEYEEIANNSSLEKFKNKYNLYFKLILIGKIKILI